MSEQLDLFSRPIRKISAMVDMSFYASSDDNNAEVDVNWQEPSAGNALEQEVFERNKWQRENRKQLLSFGLEPKYPYCFLDGNTQLVAPSQAEEGKGSNVCFPAADTVFPLPSDCICSKVPQAGQSVQYPFEGRKPKYSLDYYELPRRINQIMIVAGSKLNQFPVSYTIKLKGTVEGSQEIFKAGNFLTGDFQEIVFESSAQEVPVAGTNYIECSYHITNGANVKQQVVFPKYYQAVAITLEIESWNKGGTPAKIMYFSNDLRISLDESEISSISVLEEKTDGDDTLSYGITSNSCTVKMLNSNDRFTRNLDLLKKNRNIHPFVTALPLGGEQTSQKYPLGKFYSEDWTLEATSNFITCRGYDILYNLQNMNLYYTLDQNDSGQYIMDGGWRGSACENCPIMDEGCRGCGGKKDNACYVYKKIFMLINKQKADSGIYGADIKYNIDPKLKNIKMNHVLLGYDTAWNVLQDMANFTLSNVHVDRSGRVCVARDEFGGEAPGNAVAQPIKASITPSNCFSYNLPTMSKTIVNRVTVPYVEVVSDNVQNDKDITINANDCIVERNDNGNVTMVTINLELKNLYEVITGIECQKGGTMIVPKEIKLCFGYCTIIFGDIGSFEKIDIEVKTIQPYKSISDSFTVTLNNALSQKQNGIKEYELLSKKLILGKQDAENIAKLLLENYKSGKSYIETDWQGTPELQLGDNLISCTRKDSTLVSYECISNEFTIDGGLRAKTKARQK